ncbi:S9 family peptidase [Prolixibacteraceae bacterium JC049]|nr:S9 family peptidase [Prolixibacteraceae bacterium JC049]
MKRLLILVSMILCVVGVKAQLVEYPTSKREVVTDTFFEKYKVEDPYRWMENIYSPEMKSWVKEETKLSNHLLRSYARKNDVYRPVDQYNCSNWKSANKLGKYFFTKINYSEIGQASLCYKKELTDDWDILVDPNYISNQDEIRLKQYKVSKDSKYLAYLFNRNGSDWREVKVVQIENKKHLADHLKDVIYSSIAWKGDGFFYSRYQKNGKFEAMKNEEVYYHRLGTDQSEDKLIFKRNGSHYRFSYTVSHDERFFFLREYNSKSGSISVFYIDYASSAKKLKPFLMNRRERFSIVDNYGDQIILKALRKSGDAHLVGVSVKNPMKWVELIPAYSKAVLLDVKCLRDQILTLYQSNQKSILAFHSYSGKLKYNLEFPVGTSVQIYGNNGDEKLYLGLRGYTIPSVYYEFNTKTYKKKLIEKTTVTFDYRNIAYSTIECDADDGSKIPVLLVHKKGMKLNGKNPLILSAYGGFGTISRPTYDPGIIYFVKQGGVYAFAGIRGSGDLGRAWSLAGRGLNKQRSFDDFTCVAKDLIKKKYTNSNKLVATGASNGGLVVAASAIQNPELFKVVIPVVAPLDMIRFEKFTVGSFHKGEYGTIDNEKGFNSLYSYSPYHNIKKNVNYPAMLVMTSNNDERVPPFHSYKFVAELQNRNAQKNPILLRVDWNAGHHGSSNIKKSVRETCDKYSFIMEMLNKK